MRRVRRADRRRDKKLVIKSDALGAVSLITVCLKERGIDLSKRGGIQM